ncbi:Synaptogyrin-3-like isoform 1 [Oopsacas minuta]|uniref:Synaptogyrin-3-like isoform 1 n=1 Tax=Oopsacas minuta TaxID=111878 RepID=A0AAV7K063_9METZ|nr:Synaptogyrin-3-like isoform 1 [Oopsacas minuta]
MAIDFSMDKVFINFQALDPIEFGKQVLLKFEIYLRLMAVLFSIIVFACISDKALYLVSENGQGRIECLYNKDTSACNYGIAVGILAFLSNLMFLVVDVGMEVVIQPLIYRVIALSILIFNVFWGFLWFVLFCLLANRWNSTPSTYKATVAPLAYNDTQAAIAFSFFSILVYVGIALLGLLRVVRGPGFIGDISYYQQLFHQNNPYGKFDSSESGADSYQAPREETY